MPKLHRARELLVTLAAAAGLGLALPVAGAGVVSGLEVGAPTVSIPVVDVTGPYKGELICYVCEFQDDPNVLAFFRATGDDTAALIVELDALYRANKDRNFKAVAMIVAGDSAKPWLEQLKAEKGIEIPLVVLRRGPKDVAVRLYSLNPEVDNTFLVTVDRFVAANVAGISAGEFSEVADATTAMLAARPAR
jgi:hypothetical protein